MNSLKILSTTVTFGKYTQEPIRVLEELGCDVTLNSKGRPYTEEELIEVSNGVDVLIVGNDYITKKVIESNKSLKMICMHGIGLDKIDLKAAEENNVIVTNAPFTNHLEVAELVIGYIVTMYRNLYLDINNMKHQTWKKSMGTSINEKTIGIVGMGSIGKALASMALGLNMKVIAYDLYPSQIENVNFVDLNKLISESDVISLHVPYVKGTKPIIGSEEVEMMKDSALLVNTARAQLVDEQSVIEALNTGKIGGYARDVYPVEPPEFDLSFQKNQIISTPHIGGATYEANLRMGMTVANNIKAYINEEKIPYRCI
ncbi:phosphoglycerate dehydrogenase [Erysipelothrix sp. HDW6A]|uniref:phosphoglycerate dehydrogenase n=1 Tax=Erysipelothrix sp. HDW6A TaxID=2714928 RepID=UPI00140E2EC9|nr:phosphoglycerate dehydrogenase [Erysipelothrix sp. HDW6A]QIK56916.1 phosphoglycerate dehydrogenase [Erysipelothrix sp. HDW6A]